MKAIYGLALAVALVGAPVTASFAGEGCPAGGCCGAKETKVVQLKTEELAKLVAEKKAVVIDVNPAERFAKGHVPGAKNVAGADKVDATVLPADKAALVVFYCAGLKCGASEKAAKKAVELGHTNVAVYKPGIAGWEEAKQAVETGAPKNPA